MVEPLFAHPGQTAVATVIHMNDDLVLISRVLLDAAHAQLEQVKIVPSGNQDGKHERVPSDMTGRPDFTVQRE